MKADQQTGHRVVESYPYLPMEIPVTEAEIAEAEAAGTPLRTYEVHYTLLRRVLPGLCYCDRGADHYTG